MSVAASGSTAWELSLMRVHAPPWRWRMLREAKKRLPWRAHATDHPAACAPSYAMLSGTCNAEARCTGEPRTRVIDEHHP